MHTQEQLDCVLAEKHHPNILFVKLDVTDPVDKLLAGELARMFDIEAYFGNASVGTGGSMAEIGHGPGAPDRSRRTCSPCSR